MKSFGLLRRLKKEMSNAVVKNVLSNIKESMKKRQNVSVGFVKKTLKQKTVRFLEKIDHRENIAVKNVWMSTDKEEKQLNVKNAEKFL